MCSGAIAPAPLATTLTWTDRGAVSSHPLCSARSFAVWRVDGPTMALARRRHWGRCWRCRCDSSPPVATYAPPIVSARRLPAHRRRLCHNCNSISCSSISLAAKTISTLCRHFRAVGPQPFRWPVVDDVRCRYVAKGYGPTSPSSSETSGLGVSVGAIAFAGAAAANESLIRKKPGTAWMIKY